MKVQNMISNKGNKIANQFIMSSDYLRIFQSYDSIIVKIMTLKGISETTLDKKYWNYSVTTGKYRNQFLGESKRETQLKIDRGEYRLADLN